jgi:hypothetical protein
VGRSTLLAPKVLPDRYLDSSLFSNYCAFGTTLTYAREIPMGVGELAMGKPRKTLAEPRLVR